MVDTRGLGPRAARRGGSSPLSGTTKMIIKRKMIIYSPHLTLRLELREIPYNLPRSIFETAAEYYFDRQTQNKIAVKQIILKNKLRELAVVYKEINSHIVLVTIHPLKKYQKNSRIKSGRWQKL